MDPLDEVKRRLEEVYIDRAHPPITYDWCRLCKARNQKAGEPIWHWTDCPLDIVEMFAAAATT